MANNTHYIFSITRQSDFEDLVRLVAKVIFDADAYLVGGPYDAGLDLIYKRGGKEVKEAVQITIQEKSIEAKILEDAEKTKKLVATHGYPERLTFFWSRKMSNSLKLSIKKSVRDKTGIDLEIYDATIIDQIITDDEPEILHYLLKVIHKIDVNVTSAIDPKARAFYEYLALGKDTADLKTSIIDAQILSSLFKSPLHKDALAVELEESGIKRGATSARTAALCKLGRLSEDELIFSLTKNELTRVKNILAKDELERFDLLDRLKKFSIPEIGADISSEALEIIREVYRVSVDIQISEVSFEPPRMSLAKDLVRKLEKLIHNKCGLGEQKVHALAKELLKIGAENEYLSNQCSSLLCVALLGQKKLESYIRERRFFIYLDASVYIRYLALYGFNTPEYFDAEMRITANLRDSIRSLPLYRVSITREHLEETVRHITQAEKISRFASDAIIQTFGESKNVYFNLYLRERRKSPGTTFDKFLEKLIGYERSADGVQSKFDSYLSCVQRFNAIARIDVPDSPAIEYDAVARKISSRYESWTSQVGKSRKHRTAFNDVTACYIMSDDQRHLDDKGYGHVPMFVTWDSTQHQLRDIFRSEFPHAEWLIYSPQRAIERFSMLDFSVNSGRIKDNVLAILDEDYTRDSSLVDALATLFGEDAVESDAIVSVLTKLSGRLHGEASEAGHFEVEERNTIAEALLSIEYEFKNVFDDVRRAFAVPTNEERIINMLLQYIGGKIKKDGLNQEVNRLVEDLHLKSAPTND